MTQAHASFIYMTQAHASFIYMTQAHASFIYMTQAHASFIYMTVSFIYVTQAHAWMPQTSALRRHLCVCHGLFMYMPRPIHMYDSSTCVDATNQCTTRPKVCAGGITSPTWCIHRLVSTYHGWIWSVHVCSAHLSEDCRAASHLPPDAFTD